MPNSGDRVNVGLSLTEATVTDEGECRHAATLRRFRSPYSTDDPMLVKAKRYPVHPDRE